MLEVITHPVFLIVLCVVISLIASGLFMWVLSYFVASYLVYVKTLKRRSKDDWGRTISDTNDPELKEMYDLGYAWHDANISYKKDVHIVNNGLNLYGEYYDFGSDRCVMILSGRTESLVYGYYFAIPYANNGCNVLVMDPRGHGFSDGEYNTTGFEESKDDIAWVKFLQEEFNIRSVIFHGICIGAAGGMYALTSGECPDCVEAIVTEGMFANFYESMKNHLIERKKPTFIMTDLINAWMKRYTGHSMKFGPIDVIQKLDRPLLMLHSKEDLYSVEEYAQKLYDKAGCENKKIVWFDHGRHSMLRITDTERYDSAITDFLRELSNDKNTVEGEKENVL